MSFDLKNLQLLVQGATLGAIAQAGAEFRLSPTNITQRIKALESDRIETNRVLQVDAF